MLILEVRIVQLEFLRQYLVNTFDENLAREVAKEITLHDDDEKFLIDSFVEVCRFLGEYPSEVSWKKNKKNLA